MKERQLITAIVGWLALCVVAAITIFIITAFVR